MAAKNLQGGHTTGQIGGKMNRKKMRGAKRMNKSKRWVQVGALALAILLGLGAVVVACMPLFLG